MVNSADYSDEELARIAGVNLETLEPENFQDATARRLGLEDLETRGTLLPLGKTKEGETVLAWPEIGIEAFKSFTLPGHVTGGGQFEPRDVTNMAIDAAFMGKAPKVKQTVTAPIKRLKLTGAEKRVAGALVDDFGDDALDVVMKRQAQTSEPLVMIGDESVAGLTETGALFPSGKVAAQAGFKPLTEAAAPKFEASLKKMISPEFSVKEATETLAKQAEEIASPLYKKAFKANKVMASERLNRILDTPAARKAIKATMEDVQNKMQLAAKPDPELGMVARELAGMDVPGGVGKGFSLETLNSIKIKLDKRINAALKSANAADRDAADAMIDVKNALLDELDALDRTGLYNKARNTRADIYSIENALDAGRDFFATRGKTALTDEDLVKQFKGYNPQQQQAFKTGMMQETLAKVRSVREGANPTSFLKTPAMQNRLRAILGGGYDEFMQTANTIGKTYDLRNQILRGSQTASRTEAVKQFSNELADEAMNNVRSGFSVRDAIIDAALNRGRRYMSRMSDDTAREVVEIALETDPKKQLAFLNKVKLSKTPNVEKVAKVNLFDAVNEVSRIAPMLARGSTQDTEGLPTVQTGTGNEYTDQELIDIIRGSGMELPSELQTQSTYEPLSFDTTVTIPDSTRQNEGLRLNTYIDTTGNRTVGFGFNLDSPSARNVWKQSGIQADFNAVRKGDASLTMQEAEALASASTRVALDDVMNVFPDYLDYSPARQEALFDLSYQLGGPTLNEFKGTIAAVKKGNWTTAARNLLKSKYAKQVPNRARRVARALING